MSLVSYPWARAALLHRKAVSANRHAPGHHNMDSLYFINCYYCCALPVHRQLHSVNKHASAFRTVLFWVIIQRVVVIAYRSFGTVPAITGPAITVPQTSVSIYRYSLCNIPEESSSHLLRGRSLKSHMRQQHSFPDRYVSSESFLFTFNK
jgi:hypothetical protein